MFKKIFLSSGQVSLVSDEDFLYLSGYNWCVNNRGYVTGRVDRETESMHRIIAKRAGIDISNQIDHINGNKLDNQRKNLRPATQSQNMAYHDGYSARSGYKGVTPAACGYKWQARIQKNGRQYHLGLFDTPEEAHEAYVKAAKQLHGEFAHD